MRVFLGSDHGGFRLKGKIKEFLDHLKIPNADLGPQEFSPEDDYVDYAVKVSREVCGKKGSFGILICRSGTGMAIAANKIKGIRAARCTDVYTAKMSRHDEDANVLALRSEGMGIPMTKKIILAFLKSTPSKAARHKRRLNKIRGLER